MSVACNGKHSKSTRTNGWRLRGIRNCDWDVAFTPGAALGLLPRIAAHLHGVLSCNQKAKYSLGEWNKVLLGLF
ncbi:hypothetical protein CEXT_341321 [Caerostris extrusa]|uniref:Uncharacterized protein n=1 Tax=Caerostris extrusa TaxID=172846 RepID=A0AAV4RUR9_CAEEX|nr:hypothetical protein CEXT_341321 [Caerostris extrusa]